MQRVLPHYRLDFFERLVAVLAKDGFDVRVLYGREDPGTVPRSVQVDREWGVPIENVYGAVLGREIVWQRLPRGALDTEFVILEQANRLLLNHWLMIRHVLYQRPRLAFWGHGRNYQAGPGQGGSEWLKRILAGRVDWWFAYTEAAAEGLTVQGFAEERVTAVNNSVDVSSLRDTVAQLRASCKWSRGNHALYCGGMYREKCIDFLLDACLRIRAQIPDFEITFIGDGPDSEMVVNACKRHPWMHYAGAVTGEARAPFFAAARLILMPGAVGLVVIDAFATETPLITHPRPTHGPEYSYLVNGVNGVVSSEGVEGYADAVIGTLSDPALLDRLAIGCKESAARYSFDHMVERFASGVRKWAES